MLLIKCDWNQTSDRHETPKQKSRSCWGWMKPAGLLLQRKWKNQIRYLLCKLDELQDLFRLLPALTSRFPSMHLSRVQFRLKESRCAFICRCVKAGLACSSLQSEAAAASPLAELLTSCCNNNGDETLQMYSFLSVKRQRAAFSLWPDTQLNLDRRWLRWLKLVALTLKPVPTWFMAGANANTLNSILSKNDRKVS